MERPLSSSHDRIETNLFACCGGSEINRCAVDENKRLGDLRRKFMALCTVRVGRQQLLSVCGVCSSESVSGVLERFSKSFAEASGAVRVNERVGI